MVYYKTSHPGGPTCPTYTLHSAWRLPTFDTLSQAREWYMWAIGDRIGDRR